MDPWIGLGPPETVLQAPFVLVIDEVQEFLQINPAIFSDIQELWDLYLYESQVQLVMLGSVYSLMKKIFQDSKEPLFGRADRIGRRWASGCGYRCRVVSAEHLRAEARWPVAGLPGDVGWQRVFRRLHPRQQRGGALFQV